MRCICGRLVLLAGIVVHAALLGGPLLGEEPILTIDSGGHMSMVRGLIFTPDGKFLISAGDKEARIWDIATGKTVRTIRGQIGPGLEGAIYAAALSPDGQTLAVGGRLTNAQNELIRLFDWQTGTLVGVLSGHLDAVVDLDFSPDGRFLAAGGKDHVVRVWEIATKRLMLSLTGNAGVIEAVAFSPNSRWLVSGSREKELRIWDIASGRLAREMKGSKSSINSVTFSPDGRYIVSGEYAGSRRWDVTTGKLLREFNQPAAVSSQSFSPDGHRLLVCGENCLIVAYPEGSVEQRLDKAKNTLLASEIMASAISPDGKYAATGDSHGEITIWQIDSGKIERELEGQGRPVWSVGFGATGRTISFGQTFANQGRNHWGPLEHSLHLRSDEEESHARPPIQAVEAVGGLELRTAPNHASVLQVVRPKMVVQEIKRDDHSGYVHGSFTFTPDGRSIVSGGNIGYLYVYDTKSGDLRHQLVGHSSAIWAVAVSTDGKFAVSGSEDETIRVWDLASGKNLLTIFPAADGEWVAWTPEGYYASSLHGDRYIGWQVNQGKEKAALYYPGAQFQAKYYRPDVVAELLRTGDIGAALARANASRGSVVTQAAASIETILPPSVFVTSPKEGEEVHQQALRIKAAALSPNLPITDLRVLLNGVQIAGVQEGRTKGKPREREVEIEVTLQPGQNTLTFVAAHEQARSEPEERHVTYVPPLGGQAAPEKPSLILLAIGISDYADASLALSYADDDARSIAQTLEGQRNKLFGKVLSRVLPAVGGRAGRAEILDGLKWLRTQGTPRDVRVLFLSGHGGFDDRRNFYFYSQDQKPTEEPDLNSLRGDRLLEELVAARSPAILMIDACHAGAAATSSPARTDLTEVIKVLRERFQLVALAASTGTELSVERKEWGHGAFTQALLEGLSGKADGFGGDKDGRIEIKELGAWVVDRVPKLTGGSQHALFDSGWVDASFPIFALEGGAR